ncbi:MAG: anaerobic glycerol-3-phosphate dehydrogenase subunit C [Bacteroidales bacterium]|nr:anaerobic glycerol-3-phosphate dehydrogenase subunit C [Bacteroidales bacterium]
MQEKNISANNFEQCQKCSLCETVCPVMANNPEYGGPKRSGPDGERYRLKNGIFYDDSLKYCLNCKRCEVACPSGVRIADLIQQARIDFNRRPPKLRDMMLASTDQMGPVASAFAPIVNFSLGLAPVKGLLDVTIGLDHRRTLPKYSSETFVRWFNKHAAASQDSFRKHVSYYHGCYANYNYPQLAKDFVAVMNAFGYGVHLIERERCCGVAKIANGMIEAATRDAKINMAAFRKSISAGRDIITVSTTCTMTLLEEYPELLKVDNGDVKAHINLVEQFLYKAIASGEVKPVWKEGWKARAAYHCPCHQERLGLGIFTTELLKMIPGMELIELESNCCGIAGTYGFKKENFKVSQMIGRPLFDEIAAVAPEFVACECETCKWQIEMSTGVAVKNPVSILADALDLQKTSELNSL